MENGRKADKLQFLVLPSFCPPLPSLNALCALFFVALFLPSVNVLPVPSCLPSLCPLLKTFIFFFFVPSLYPPLPSLNALCALFLFALFLPSSNALSVPSFLPFFVPSFEIIYIFLLCAHFPFDLPVLFERLIFHNVWPHSDQPPDNSI